ncbi:MAG TPA: tetratricopeptide repeat protein [Candidatus Acidoferrales bacterium]|nr:tetratricopeptide repeat protein [Candidatus Acidoferrales bacterium]
MRRNTRCASLTLCILLSSAALPAQGPGERQQPEFIKQGRQLMREGKLEDALALYRRTLQSTPNSLDANIAAGSVLDLMGQGSKARGYFQKAIDSADTSEHKAIAERAMAMSYAFDGNCPKAGEYERRVFEYYGSVKNLYQQGEIADEAARVCIDASPDSRGTSADLDAAARWYALGRQTGLQEPNIQPARVDLWNFRWQHAQARLAARRGDKAAAQGRVVAAKAILDQGKIPQQTQFFPYLQGYVAFYGGDYKAALADLLKANQDDAFIQCMLGRTYEALGDKSKAIEYYQKAAAAISHNPPAAYAVPFAKKRLAALRG